jgi:flagellar hook assembly protein FlgD
LRGGARGAQRASSRETQPIGARHAHAAVVAALAFLIAFGGHALLPAQGVRAGSDAGTGQKAVFIVGPASSSTWEYIDQANEMAAQAEAEGMRVIKVFTPHATWQRVLDVIQNANLVVYFGHGNGWPSPYPPFQEDTKDGFGLNPSSGGGTSSPTDYHGGNNIRGKITLAKNAVVVLYRLCYAEGNAESGMRPEYPDSASDRNIATERVDNFAAAFLHVGASVVFGWGWPQKINLPKQLAETNLTMDKIFMDKANNTGSPNAFIGTDDYYRDSSRTDGARIHLDPHRVYGHLRALTGNLQMTAAEWRGEPPPPDNTAPTLSSVDARVDGKVYLASAVPASFSPNGDGLGDRLVIDHKLSEPAYIDVGISDAGGNLVRHFRGWSEQGPGATTWNGNRDGGTRVADGFYRVSLTPVDNAGNKGASHSVNAEVLTTLRAPTRSRPAIDVGDEDSMATSVRLGVTVADDATVSWNIVDAGGETVYTHLDTHPETAGVLGWMWNGRTASGALVPDGMYRAIVSASNDLGTVRYSRPVYVGPYRLRLSDSTPARGERVKVSVYSTEPQTGTPTLTISQPGVADYTVRLELVSSTHTRAYVTFKSSGTAGDMTIRITGTDIGDQVESEGVSVYLH